MKTKIAEQKTEKHDEKERHYKATLQFFKETAVKKDGFYDGKEKDYYIWQKMVRKAANSFFKRIQSNDIEKVSDLGCGRGDFTLDIASEYKKINFTGIDFCDEVLEIANKLKNGAKNVDFKKGNLLDLNFPDKEFDASLCINALLHIHPNDIPKALSEIARVTKRYIILEIKNKRNFYNMYLRHKTPFKVISVEKEDVIGHLKKHNFVLIDSSPIFMADFLSPIITLLFEKNS